MDEQSQQLAAELSQIGDRLCEIYEQLRQPGNQINIKLCDFLQGVTSAPEPRQ